jgi:hypothetical protein
MKMKETQILHQYLSDRPIKDVLLRGLKRFANVFIGLHNEIFSRSVPLFDILDFSNRNTIPCSFLSVSFEEDQVERASEVLLEDLRKLHRGGYILGHLTMPHMFLLAGIVGGTKRSYCMSCFLFLDHRKLYQKFDKTPLDLNTNTPFKELLDIKTETTEGETSWLDGVNPIEKYEIEIVNVF